MEGLYYTMDQTSDLFAPEGQNKQMLLLRVSYVVEAEKGFFWGRKLCWGVYFSKASSHTRPLLLSPTGGSLHGLAYSTTPLLGIWSCLQIYHIFMGLSISSQKICNHSPLECYCSHAFTAISKNPWKSPAAMGFLLASPGYHTVSAASAQTYSKDSRLSQ